MEHGWGASQAYICVLTPPFCSRSSATASTNEVTPIPGNLSIAATRATIDEAVLADLGDEDDDEDAGEYNYFGDMPNPDCDDKRKNTTLSFRGGWRSLRGGLELSHVESSIQSSSTPACVQQ